MAIAKVTKKVLDKKETRLEKLKEIVPKFEGKDYYYSLGKRKTSSAQVRLYAGGKGEFYINGKKYDEYFPVLELQTIMVAPLTTLGLKSKYDICAYVNGGGIRGQSEAICHGVARALVKSDDTFKLQLKKAGLYTRDARQVERKKPGKKKARKSPTWSKR